jgi:hypothetical protein
MLKYIYILIMPIICGACLLEKDIELEVPTHTSTLVAECYIEPNQPILLALSQNANIYQSNIDLAVNNARVDITFRGSRQRLQNRVTHDTLYNKIYNYRTNRQLPENYEEEVFLHVTDREGRQISAKTKLLPPIAIKNVTSSFNGDLASIIVEFDDIPNQDNYYRININHIDNPRQPANFTWLTDKGFQGKGIKYISEYVFRENDQVVITLFHISKEHYDFRVSVSEASISNGNPFQPPTAIQSNIVGGTGIFTGIGVSRQNHTIKR